jgi:RNA polymerase-binding transcription factor DksA
MNRQEFDQLRKKLEQWHADVLRKLTVIECEGRGLKQDSPEDIGETSVRSFSKELLFQQATQNRRLLRSIEAAIERIGLGTFGVCVSLRQSNRSEAARSHAILLRTAVIVRRTSNVREAHLPKMYSIAEHRGALSPY